MHCDRAVAVHPTRLKHSTDSFRTNDGDLDGATDMRLKRHCTMRPQAGVSGGFHS